MALQNRRRKEEDKKIDFGEGKHRTLREGRDARCVFGAGPPIRMSRHA